MGTNQPGHFWQYTWLAASSREMALKEGKTPLNTAFHIEIS